MIKEAGVKERIMGLNSYKRNLAWSFGLPEHLLRLRFVEVKALVAGDLYPT